MEFIRIENRKTWLIDIPNYHPDTTPYDLFWRKAKKNCIEGVWNKDFNGYRFMTGNLYFYINFCRILDFDVESKTRKSIRPILTDLMWELAYMVAEAKGFSGFADDDEFTGNYQVYRYERDMTLKIKFHSSCYNKAGELKKYKSPRDLLRGLHNEPKGLPLYINEAKNTMCFGTRGGGKSYFYGLAVFLYGIIFDGAKTYNEDSIKKPAEIHLNIGSWESSKSSEICEKIEACMNAFATDSELGVWGDESNDDYEPMPFFKSMAGSLTPNNAKSPWTHEYDKKINGRWIKKGSKSKLVHTNYKDNATAGAGGRYTDMLIEECGLHPLLRTSHGSNIGCTQRDTEKVGCLHYIGTSGDIEKVRESKEMFMQPEVYDILEYDDIWESSGKIGFFIPAYYSSFKFKDENGNTMLEEAKEAYQDRRAKVRKGKDPTQYQAEMMNYPIKPSEMFLTKKGNILPQAELEQHRNNLMLDPHRGQNETYGNLVFNDTSNRGIKFIPKPKHEAFPIKVFPTPKDYSIQGELIIYEFPIEDKDGNVPNIYNIGYDPVHKDEEGTSLNCIHVFKTPKAFTKYGGNELVASFIGRPELGRHPVNQLAEKLAMFYGNHPRMIYYEQGGNNVKEYFEKRMKLNLLATQPTTVLTDKYHNGPSRSVVYGVPMSNLVVKEEAITYLRDWLLQERGLDGKGNIVRNLNLIRDTRLIEEMIAFNFEINTDSVMAFAMCIIGLEETHNQYKTEIIQKEDDILMFLNKSLQNRRKYSKY